jgi:glycosyltransferase involved in cell wall biosynthesis
VSYPNIGSFTDLCHKKYKINSLPKEADLMVKVCILTSVHSAFDIRIFHKEAMTLAKHGYDVTIIAQHDKYEISHGIKILSLRRSKNRLDRMTSNLWLLYRKSLKVNADIYHFHDSELIPIGILLSYLGKKIIYDIHEDVPKDIKEKYWIPLRIRSILSRTISLLEIVAAKTFSGLIAATPSIASRFPPIKTVVVQNLPVLQGLKQKYAYPYNQRPASVVYLGSLTEVRGPKEMITAMEFLPNSLEAKLTLAGTFSSSSLENEIRQLPGWNRVDFLGWIDRLTVRELLGNARIGLVLFHPVPNHIESQPNKIFEYMQAGIPVIASNFPLWRQILEGAGCGLLVDPFDIKAITGAIKWLLEHPKEAEHMGRRGRDAVEKRYNWEAEGKKLLAFYGHLISAKK